MVRILQQELKARQKVTKGDLISCRGTQAEDQEATAFVALLRSCGKKKDLYGGTRLHDAILKRGLLDKCLEPLVTMYAKCGELMKAKQLFDMHHCKDVLAWTALISGFAQHGRRQDALTYFEQMQSMGFSSDALTFTSLLKACGSLGALAMGEDIHDQIAKQGLLEENVALGNALVDMYAKCGDLERAQQVLEQLPVRDAISWNTIITGYAQRSHSEQALKCFEQMQGEGLIPNMVTFTCILKACGSVGAVDKGEKIHNEISKQRLLQKDIVLGNAVIDMYAKCGALAKAQHVLEEELPVRNVISWTTLIAGYAQHGEGFQALNCFERMQDEGIPPNEATFVCTLKACASLRAADKGKKIHDEIATHGLLDNSTVIGTALVDMYAKCGALAKAQQVLQDLSVRNVTCWNALLAGYTQQGKGEQALSCYEGMLREGHCPDQVTYVCVLKACGSIKAADKGEKIHKEIAKQGLLQKDIIVGNALVDMYAKCGAIAQAQKVLKELPVRNVISWNSLIAGYAQQDDVEGALSCYEGMQREGISPDEVTFTCILNACGSIGAIDKGEELNDEISKEGLLGKSLILGNALVDMYARCGALMKARRVLDELPVRDVVTWNALIAGYTQRCDGREALKCFKQMQHEGLAPDGATFSSVLSACSRLGLVEDAQLLFLEMVAKYGLSPDLEHYTCLVDLFGRAGQLDKAAGIIDKMPSSINGVWSALLGACREWGDMKVGRWAFDRAVLHDKSYPGFYVVMASIYMAAGMPEDAASIEAMMIENGAWEMSGQI